MSRTELIVLMDRSGSMNLIRSDMEGGFDRFMSEQAAVEGECYVTLVQFDSFKTDTVYTGISVDSVPACTLEPRGMTPLLDAMGATIGEVSSRLDELGEEDKPDHVVFLVITDGEENASREYQLHDIRNLVEGCTKRGWHFAYLGANVDAFNVAGGLGVNAVSASSYAADSDGVQAMYAASSKGLSGLRSGGTSELRIDVSGFSEEEEDEDGDGS